MNLFLIIRVNITYKLIINIIFDLIIFFILSTINKCKNINFIIKYPKFLYDDHMNKK